MEYKHGIKSTTEIQEMYHSETIVEQLAQRMKMGHAIVDGIHQEQLLQTISQTIKRKG